MARDGLGFIFDLDGTLVDSVYQHVMAWQEALLAEHIVLSTSRIHRRIGMSGGLFARMLLREVDVTVSPALLRRLQSHYIEAYGRVVRSIRPLPEARALLEHLTRAEIPCAITTGGNSVTAEYALELLGIEPGALPVVTRDDLKRAQAGANLHLEAAAQLQVDISAAVIIGDSVWDMLAARQASALGIGVLSGGCAQYELECAGAISVYEHPADLLRHIDEICGHANTYRKHESWKANPKDIYASN
jgi:phosphoglycolate phosphatase-like HAD superfamily hydrolase